MEWSMSGTKLPGHDEFVDLLKSQTNLSRDTEWRGRRRSQLLETIPDPYQDSLHDILVHTRDEQIEHDNSKGEEAHTRILASLVPDEILEFIDDLSIRPYESAFLFGDISGFTDLSERYNRTGQGGPSRLTQMLNSYIGAMVQEILSHNGDVLKFSGDAFFAMWKSRDNDTMEELVHEVIDCAIVIQKTYGSYLTDVGVTLRVKIAISAGSAGFSIVGDDKNAHYITVGEPVKEIKTAEYLTVAGDIVCAISAWHYVTSSEYLHEVTKDGKHVKVFGIGPSWKSTHMTEAKYQKTIENDEIAGSDINKSSNSSSGSQDTNRGISTPQQKLKKKRSNHQISYEVENFALRPRVEIAVKKHLKEKLRKFIIAPVMRGIDLNEPLKYLTEMRHVVILFVNIITEEIPLMQKYVFLVDATYKIVVRIVGENQGCVNKVSLFDKDLMMLCIFGLRGFKNQLECQVGLRSAYELREQIMRLPGIKVVSCAVTTGLTYCGVVGHNLRREYTVISMTVNKAARLMIAYPNRVVCDRETFIRSKLEGRNFILQEPKELKGLTNVGPVYKFVEQSGFASKSLAVSPFPLLGRETEIELYLQLLERREADMKKIHSEADFVTDYSNAILFRGEPRQGKTRLLDELVFLTPASIPVHRITLLPRDAAVSFRTIDLLFGILLGDTDDVHRFQREENIRKRLTKLKATDVLCALNDILKVDFPMTSFYTNLSAHFRHEIKKKLIRQLIYSCFTTLWVITIDDAEFVDDASWLILLFILTLPNLVIILALGARRPLSYIATISVNSNEISKVTLGPISKWFHAGLACQILDVKAVPAELERVIHTRSNGNPGWIESYLISLSQAGGIIGQKLPREDVLELGLVLPPTEMVSRFPDRRSTLQNIREHSHLSLQLRKDETWKMYHRCYKDSIADFRDYQSNLAEKGAVHGHIIPVVVFPPNFNLDEIDLELPMDVLTLKMFDSLTSNEKLLLKCSSALGESFLRSMLIYVMSTLNYRETALAVKKLFEIHVLSCAHGDFTTTDQIMLNKKLSFTTSTLSSEWCQCLGLKIEYCCDDLPKYASCGYLRFESTMFRETAYNLLTDNQRKEFHSRAIRYLEKETRRCYACGHGYFTKLIGLKTINETLRVRQPFLEVDDVVYERMSISSVGTNSIKRMLASSRRTNSYLIYQPKTFQRFRSTIGDVQQLQKYKKRESTHRPSSNKFLDLKEIALTSGVRKFSNVNFFDCHCNFILHVHYTQMLIHCKGAVRFNRLLETNLEYAALCINDMNIQLAVCLLHDAMEIISKQVTETDEDSTWKIPIKYGRIFLLLGKARHKSGQIEAAYEALLEAMKCFGYPFPKSTTGIYLATKFQKYRQKLIMEIFPNLLIRSKVGNEAKYVEYKSECLTVLYSLFKRIQNWEAAELAAVWSLNEALKSDLNFQCICEAYANQIDMVSFKLTNNRSMFEHLAIMLCNRKIGKMESEELRTVAYLYYIMFKSRYMHGTVSDARALGYSAYNISKTIRDVRMICKIIVYLNQTLLFSKSYFEYVDRVRDLFYYSEEDTDNTSRTFFYAYCLAFTLATGYIITPLSECEQYFNSLGEISHSYRNDLPDQYYFSALWSWFVRTSNWDEAMIWFPRIKIHLTPEFIKESSLNNCLLSLRLIESGMVLAVHWANCGNMEALIDLIQSLDACMHILQERIITAACYQPRYFHLRAYYSIISHGGNKYLDILKKAKAIALHNENMYEADWVDHSQQAWSGKMPSMLMDQWVEYTSVNPLHWRSMQSNKPIFYTLPLPDMPIKPK